MGAYLRDERKSASTFAGVSCGLEKSIATTRHREVSYEIYCILKTPTSSQTPT